jgi:hypothetical protein
MKNQSPPQSAPEKRDEKREERSSCDAWLACETKDGPKRETRPGKEEKRREKPRERMMTY